MLHTNNYCSSLAEEVTVNTSMSCELSFTSVTSQILSYENYIKRVSIINTLPACSTEGSEKSSFSLHFPKFNTIVLVKML